MRIKIRKLLLQFLIYSIAFPASGIAFSAAPDKDYGSLYLTIVATEKENIEAIRKHSSLSKAFNQLSIITSNDCSNLKPGLVLYVSDISNNKSDASESLKLAKTSVADSYSRECNTKPDSLLASETPFIHNSIYNLPEDTISWTFDDIKSELVVLDKNRSFLIERIFNGDINNEVEGRQSILYLVNTASRDKTKLLDQCWDLSDATSNNGLIAFQCMTGIAGNHYIHTSYVYDMNKKKIITGENYCQKPEIINTSKLRCQKESVDARGELTLSTHEASVD